MYRRQRNHARINSMPDGSLQYFSSYDPGLVAALKALIPASDKRWNPENLQGDDQYWLVAAKHAATLVDITRQHLGLSISAPVVTHHVASKTQLIRLEYLGAAKNRGAGEPTATGWVNGGWNAIFPLSVLRRWFELGEDSRPEDAPTLYGILGVAKTANQKAIRKAHRRAARTWHPDTCDEPDAPAQFRRIQKAWEVLRNTIKRARYDVGLLYTASVKHDQLPKSHKYTAHWRPPLKCGWLLVEGKETVGRLVVSRILQWEDVTDKQGHVMVSYWPPGGEKFRSKWI